MSSPTIVGHVAVFGGADPYALYGVDLRRHRLAWTLPLPGALGGVDDNTPAAAHGVLYIQVPFGARAPRVMELAVRATDGRVLWRRTLGTDIFNLAQVALWQGEVRAHGGEEAGVAAVAGGTLYVGSPGLPRLWALNARTGEPLWPRPAALGMHVRSAPLITAHRVFVANARRLLELDRQTGAVLLRLRLGRRVHASGILIPCTSPAPTLVGHTLLLGEGVNTRVLYAVPLSQL